MPDHAGLTTRPNVPLLFSWKSGLWAWREASVGRCTCGAPMAIARARNPSDDASIESSSTSTRLFVLEALTSRFRNRVSTDVCGLRKSRCQGRLRTADQQTGEQWMKGALYGNDDLLHRARIQEV